MSKTKTHKTRGIEMENKQISKTWEANLLPYVKIQENGTIDPEKRKESFQNWIDILIERGNISESKRRKIKYVGDEI